MTTLRVLFNLVSVTTIFLCGNSAAQTSLLPQPSSWNDHFGDGVDSDGVWLVVGDPQDSSEAYFRGSAHIYWNDGQSWNLHQRISPTPVPTAGENIFFGTSVSIQGGWMLVGAPGDDEVGVNAGAVHVYQLNEDSGLWEEFDKLFSDTPETNDRLGTGTAIDTNSGLAIASQLDATFSGELHPWKINETSWAKLTTIENPIGETGARFGNAIDLEGTTLIAGTPFEDNGKGSVWILEYNDTIEEFAVQARISPDDVVLSPKFGTAVSLFGNTIAVGAPYDGNGEVNGGSTYLFNNNGNGWVLNDKFQGSSTQAGDAFGSSLYLAGTSIVVGSPNHDLQSGDAYVFDVTGTTAVEILELLPHDPVTEGYFGRRCHIANDTVFVSALGFSHTPLHSGKLYLYGSVILFGDFDHDNDRDISDLLYLIASWGPCQSTCAADLDRNGTVDIDDLLAFINAWQI
ncbi:MAG: hypothetical protein QGI78_02475 [Phycisphaerales bacterium]|jgi:hypothetical protein|nr:hypothetical protein [Phycisphaerales bacterium]